jgi:hypothetical protein
VFPRRYGQYFLVGVVLCWFLGLGNLAVEEWPWRRHRNKVTFAPWPHQDQEVTAFLGAVWWGVRDLGPAKTEMILSCGKRELNVPKLGVLNMSHISLRFDGFRCLLNAWDTSWTWRWSGSEHQWPQSEFSKIAKVLAHISSNWFLNVCAHNGKLLAHASWSWANKNDMFGNVDRPLSKSFKHLERTAQVYL